MKQRTEEGEAAKRGLAWKIETDSILIKEKYLHLSKLSDKVSKMLKRKCLKFEVLEKRFIEVYFHNLSIFVIV
jgi:hypothetical protein